jgi:hypothetical protein
VLHSQTGPEPAGEHEQADFDDDQEADQQEVSKSANSCLLREIPKRNRKAGAFDDAPACLSHSMHSNANQVSSSAPTLLMAPEV